jgi:predicted nucleic acid-binding protein
MIHLDANFLVAALQIGSAEEAKMNQWLTSKEVLGISAVAWAEFRCGPLSQRDEQTSKQMLPAMEPLSGQDAESAARLFNQTGRRSRSLADCMIAAIAIRCGAKLATINQDDFQRFAQYGLTLA